MSNHTYLLISMILMSPMIQAGDVEIKHVSMQAIGNSWRASVTLQHDDTGWDHYADAWRVVDSDGNVLGLRVLYLRMNMNSRLHAV